MPLFSWLSQDLRHAVRSLRRTPAVTLAAVATLALAIGANTAIFSLYQAVLLRRLPVESPEQLYFVAHGQAAPLSTSSHYPWFERVRSHTEVFAGATAYNIRDFKVSSGEGVEIVVGQYASGNYHALVGVPLQLGRGFTVEDDRVLNPIAVISDGYWTRQFGRSPDVLGKTFTVGNQRVTIVGVTAPQFDGMQPGRSIDITLPMSVQIQDDPELITRTDTWTSMPLVVRLKAGADPVQARAIIGTEYREYMSLPANREFSRTSSGELRSATLQSAAQGADRLRQEYERPLQVLMGMVAVVLLIACVNLANLQLTRAPGRAREVAMRMAIGASRGRIASQLLTESLLLALCGGGAGLLLAAWGTEFVSMILRSGMRPIVIDVQPDSGVLLFATAMSLVTGLAFGLAPSWRTTRIDVPIALKVGGGVARDWRRPFGQQTLVAIQMALCLVLVFSAILLSRTILNFRSLDAGFRQDLLVLFELDARDTAFQPERLEGLCGDGIQKILRRRGVVSGSCSTMSPVATNIEGRVVRVAGFSGDLTTAPIVFANSVDPAYFETFGIAILRGRTFTTADTAVSARVAVLSDAMARYYFGDENPVGRVFNFGRTAAGPPITIVGVARDARQQLRASAPHMAYTPLSQRSEPPSGLLAAIRTSGATAGVVAAVREDVRSLSRDVAVTYVRTMEEQISASLVGERLLASLSASFALLALVLACVGLYGVMSYEVSQRVRDIGIRLALGASGRQILGRVLGQASVTTVVGIGLGVAGATAAARTLSSILFELTSSDTASLVLAIALLTATALAAAYLPALRAARVDPAITLRAE
jgi:predicted permease